jgi:SAM-dependent methyltransferase
MMAAYDLLAPHYDAVTGDSASEAAFLHDIIAQRHARAATLLDVACGTGGITALLAGAYQVSGLDISPGMLAVARGKLPEGIPLYLADMTRFNLGVRFDAIICAYQGVNHLLTFQAWESFFGYVREHLNDGGTFVFDIATVGHLMMMASIPKIVQKIGDNYLLIRVRTPDGTVFDWRLEVFEPQRDGRYRLLSQTVRTRSFPLDDIREALRRTFVNVASIDGDGNCADEDNNDRIWFVATRGSVPPEGPDGGVHQADIDEPRAEPAALRSCPVPA